MRVLVVEDEVRLAENVASALREGPNFAVDCAEDGPIGLLLAKNRSYVLIILDLMLPGLDGPGVLKNVRSRGDRTPVLILTAKAEASSIIALLNAGADDYLTKPFDLGELIARTKALIRRGKGVAGPLLRSSELEVNTVEQSVHRSGIAVDLSPTEYHILEYFINGPGVLVSTGRFLAQR